jgi:hypothetical protein
MKKTPLQLCVWWNVEQTTDRLLPQIDSLLLQFAFRVSPEPDCDRTRERRPAKEIEFCGWSRIASADQKAFFALFPSQ